MTEHTIKVQSLTPESFAVFGELIGEPSRGPDVNNEYVRFWHEAAKFSIDGDPEIGFLMLKRRPFQLRSMERHLTHTQGFIPLNGARLLLAVAPANDADKPDISQIRAFCLNGSIGVMMNIGVWHDILFPLQDSARVISLLRIGTHLDDMLIADVTDGGDVSIGIDVPESLTDSRHNG